MPFAMIILYLSACFAVTVTPGPTMLLALSNGASRRWNNVYMGIFGAALSDLVLIGSVSLGLGALLAASAVAFSIVKWIGVAYLVWLAIQLWRIDPKTDINIEHDSGISPKRAFIRSFFVALSNPKGLLFFSAFLPQFINIHRPQLQQYALLAFLTAILDSIVMACYALGGAQAARLLSARGLKYLNRTCSAALISLAGLLSIYRRANA